MLLSRLLLFSILLLSAVTLNAQITRKGMKPIEKGLGIKQKKSDFSLNQLQGKWQEDDRIDYKNNSVGFTDTILLKFTDSNKVETRSTGSTSMTLDGVAEIDDDNNLTVAADVYTIKSIDKNTMLLDDGNEYIHHFKKVNNFLYEGYGNVSVKQDDYSVPVKVKLKSILAKWSVYKRLAKPGVINNDMALIRYLNINIQKNDSTATGDLTYYQGQTSQQLPCTVTLTNGSDIKIVAGANTWNLSIFQTNSTDFIFGNAALLYFCKAWK